MSSADFVVTDTENGQVKGIKKQSCINGEYLSFQGIPFMKPPVGKLRFKVLCAKIMFLDRILINLNVGTSTC